MIKKSGRINGVKYGEHNIVKSDVDSIQNELTDLFFNNRADHEKGAKLIRRACTIWFTVQINIILPSQIWSIG